MSPIPKHDAMIDRHFHERFVSSSYDTYFFASFKSCHLSTMLRKSKIKAMCHLKLILAPKIYAPSYWVRMQFFFFFHLVFPYLWKYYYRNECEVDKSLRVSNTRHTFDRSIRLKSRQNHPTTRFMNARLSIRSALLTLPVFSLAKYRFDVFVGTESNEMEWIRHYVEQCSNEYTFIQLGID